jgi:hypothetical protein
MISHREGFVRPALPETGAMPALEEAFMEADLVDVP